MIVLLKEETIWAIPEDNFFLILDFFIYHNQPLVTFFLPAIATAPFLVLALVCVL